METRLQPAARRRRGRVRLASKDPSLLAHGRLARLMQQAGLTQTLARRI